MDLPIPKAACIGATLLITSAVDETSNVLFNSDLKEMEASSSFIDSALEIALPSKLTIDSVSACAYTAEVAGNILACLEVSILFLSIEA